MVELTDTVSLIKDIASFDPEAAISRIKTSAGNQLKSLEPRATIHFTEYFNHSYAPDIVIRWPGSRDERYVYLRTTGYSKELDEDISQIAEHKPIVLSLGLPVSESSHGVEAHNLNDKAKSVNTLISNLEAIGTLGSQAGRAAAGGLLNSGIVKGGRGFLTPDVAKSAVEIVDSGLEGARSLDQAAVQAARKVALDILQPIQSRRIEQLYKAVWLGVGGRLDQYPGVPNLDGTLDDETWNYLLGLDEVIGLDFWRRIGNKLGIEQINRLSTTNKENFHNLIKANVETIWARACIILDESDSLFSNSSAPPSWEWTIERNVLALKGQSFSVFFGEKLDALPNQNAINELGVSLDDLIARANSQSITNVTGQIEQVEFALSGKNDANVFGTRLLNIMANVPQGDLSVTRVTARAHSSAHMQLNFPTSTATASGGAHVPLVSFVECAVPLLRTVNDGEMKEILASSLSSEPVFDLFSYISNDELSISPEP